MKFLGGEQIAHFVLSFDTSKQINLDAEVIVQGETVSGSFPLTS